MKNLRFFPSLPAFAGLVLAIATPAMADFIVVQTFRGGSGDQANMTTLAGQTFTTGSLGSNTRLSSIALVGPATISQGDIGNGFTGPFRVRVWNWTADAETWAPGTLLAESDNLVTILDGDQTVVANFSSGLLADNTVYGFSFTNESNVDHASFRMGLTASTGAGNTGGPLGASGKLFHNGGNPSFGDNRELAFTVTSIPEPTSLAVMGMGTLLMASRRRR